MSENKILVVDDDRSVSTGIRITLEDKYDVSTSNSAEEAFEHLAGNKVDLVLMDIKMPFMNGLEALRKIREKDTETPVVILTAYPTDDNMKEAWASGVNGFISKPFTLDELRDFVDKTMSKNRK